MSTLAEIESAAAELPAAEKRQLVSFLARQLVESPPQFPAPSEDAPPSLESTQRPCHSILDIPTVSVGKILKPLSPDDDLLGEMLDERRF